MIDNFTDIAYILIERRIERRVTDRKELYSKSILDEACPRKSEDRCFEIGFQQSLDFLVGYCHGVVLRECCHSYPEPARVPLRLPGESECVLNRCSSPRLT